MVRNHVGKRALVAIAAGLALVGTPAAFALTAAPTVAVAAQEQAGPTVQVTGGQTQFTDAINRSHASVIELTGNGDDGNGMFNFWKNIFGNWSQNGSTPQTINIESDLTIVNKTKNPNAYLYGAHFEVKAGAKLTLIDVNIDDARNEGAGGPAVPAITVQAGGSLETSGTGDIVTDNGQGEAWAVKLESSNDPAKKATAILGAAPSGFMANIGEDGWTADNAGNYGGTYCVTAGLNSDLTITDGRFTTENAAHQAIQSYGSVKIEPASDSAVFSTNNENGDYLGTVEIDGTLNGQPTGAKLVANHSIFGYIAPGGLAQVGDEAIKSTLQLNGSAKAYLTDSAVNSINDSKVGALPAVWLDNDATLYEQEDETNPAQTPSTFSTDFDTPAFQNDFKSVYEGDHLTKNQYKAQVTLPSENHGVAEDVTSGTVARGLWKLTGDTTPADLEGLVNADRTKLTDGAKETKNDDGSSVLSANLALGKSKVYGEYELTKGDDTSIQGNGHAYAFSQVHDLQAGWDVSVYRNNGTTFTALKSGDTNGDVDETVPDGLVFAGWYKVGGDLTTGAASGTPWNSDVAVPEGNAAASELKPTEKTGYAYAKFIPADFLKASAQRETVTGKTGYNVRFLSAVDSYNYNNVAYKVQLVDQSDANEGDAKTINTTTAFDYLGVTKGGTTSKVRAWDSYATADGKYSYAADKVHAARYFTRAVVKDVDANFNGAFKVTVSLTTPDGTVVTGPESTLTTASLNNSVK